MLLSQDERLPPARQMLPPTRRHPTPAFYRAWKESLSNDDHCSLDRIQAIAKFTDIMQQCRHQQVRIVFAPGKQLAEDSDRMGFLGRLELVKQFPFTRR